MGGKTGTTTQQVSIPPEVLARYNSVNAQAQQTAAQPFQQYSTDPNAFVAPLNQQQQAGIGNINQYATSAQPAYGAALQGTAQAYQGYNPQNYQQGVAGYMNPFVSQAMGATAAQLQNINQQQQQQLLGQGISSGAFGGDRGKIAQAALANQQNLATGNVLANLASTGYQNAAQNYMAGLGQQGALAGQLGTLGAGAQTAGLAGAQAQLGAGTLGQQTQQAGNTALYNQFLQQQAYPFQVAQFLANIAEGTGALSGSTTTTQQPMPFFSDRRLKEDIKKIGTAYNGLPIYTYKYKGDDTEQTHIGFMADEVEKKHPEAVGLAGGYKTVDYEKASRPAHYSGGLVSEGGAVGMGHAGEGYANGGYADYYDPNSIQNIILRHQGIYSSADAHPVPSMRSLSGGMGKHSRVPEANLPIGSLKTAGSTPAMPDSAFKQGLGAATEASDFATKGKDFYDWLKKQHMFDSQSATPSANETVNALAGQNANISGNARGGLVGYADGGDVPYEKDEDKKLDIPNDPNKHTLVTAQNPTGAPSQTGMSLGDAMSAGKMAMSAAPAIGDFLASLAMFAKDGGAVRREHHADGDAVGDKPVEITPDYVRNIAAKSAAAAGLNPTRPLQIGQLESGFNHDAVGDEGSSFGPFQMHYGNVSQKFPHGGLGDTFTAETGYDLRDPAVRKDPKAIQANADWVMDYMKKHGDSAWSTSRQLSNKPDSNADMPVVNAKPAQAMGSDKAKQNSKKDGFDVENFLIPALTGLGAMASSNSPYAGAAILQGLGAGAQSYLTTAQKKAAIAQTLQETEAIKSEMAKGAFMPGQRGNIIWVKGENGQVYPMSMADYQNLRKAGRAPEPAFQQGAEGAAAPAQPYEVPEGGTTTTAPAVEPTAVGGAQHPLYDAQSHTAAQNEQSQFDPTVGGPAIDTNYKLSNDYIHRVAQEADAARANGRNVQELSSNLANAVTLKGGATPGPTFDARAYAFGLANVAARAAGLPEVSSADSTEAIASKINAIQSFMQAHGADQNSLGALRTATSTVPNPNMPPEAFAPLSAMLMVQQKRAIDAKNHADNWSQDSGGTYLGASKDFSRKTAQVYADDQNALAALMLKSPKMFQQFMNGRDSQGQPIDETRMINVLKAAGYKPRVAKYFVLGE